MTTTSQAERTEWEAFAHAQYIAAEAECRGNLVNADGVDAGISDWSLWSGPAPRAYRYATEELRNFWDANPRLTITEYRAQAAAARRDEREQYAAARVPGYIHDDITEAAEILIDMFGGATVAGRTDPYAATVNYRTARMMARSGAYVITTVDGRERIARAA